LLLLLCGRWQAPVPDHRADALRPKLQHLLANL